MNKAELSGVCRQMRRDIINMTANAGSGHPGGSLSAVELMASVFYNHMRIDPENPHWEGRDRFVLSKGHAAPCYYAVLAELGFISRDEFKSFRQLHSILQGHPDCKKVPGVDASTGKETGLEVVRQVYPKLSMTPGILLAPRFSADATVSAALQAKTKSINSVFGAVCIVDINSKTDGAVKYTDVKTKKEEQAVSDPNAYAVWPYAKVGEVVYSGSALAAALTAYTDAQNDDTPNVGPSNKTLAISAACLADGTEVVLDQEQANTVNSFGVATWLNMNGFRLWGNNTAAYPGITDPKDRWFSVRRFMTWAANSFILTYFQKVDSPANKRLIEAIVDSENVRGNGFVARGVCARYEITYNEDENTTTDLLNGKITFHQYITPFTPAEDIEDIIEFDPNALSAALN